MKRSKLFILLGLLIVVSFVSIYWLKANISANNETNVTATIEDTESAVPTPANQSIAPIPEAVQPANSSPSLALQSHEHESIEHEHESNETPVPFESLPKEMQEEIRRLNSNDNNDLVVEQITPTQFRINLIGVHQHVPVAIINEDGTVSIREY